MGTAAQYKPELKNTVAGPFNKAAPDSLDTQKVNTYLNAKIKGMDVPKEFSGNPGEWQRRMGEISRENIADKYLGARQEGKSFGTGDAIRTIDALPADYKPVKNETYAMENGGDLKPGTLQAQKTLDSTTDALMKADFVKNNSTAFADSAVKANAGTADGVSKTLAQNKIPAADAINYAELKTGNSLSEGMKTTLLEKEKAPATLAPAPAANASAPAPSAGP